MPTPWKTAPMPQPDTTQEETQTPLQVTDRFSLEGFDPLAELRNERMSDTLQGKQPTMTELQNQSAEEAAHYSHATSKALSRVSMGDPFMRFMPELKVKPRQRGGRAPAFYRAEVESIRADKRRVTEIAASYRCSEMTIRRIQRRGIYADFEYIAADDVDRRVLEDGSYVQQPMHSDRTHHVTTGKPAGRPFPQRGGKPLTDTERREIAVSDESARILADRYKVSFATIARIRRQALAPIPETMTVYEAMARDIRPPHVIARAYKTTAAQVYAARQRYPQAYAEATAKAEEAWQEHLAHSQAQTPQPQPNAPSDMYDSGYVDNYGEKILYPLTPEGNIIHPDYGEVTVEQYHIIEKDLAEQADEFEDWLAEQEEQNAQPDAQLDAEPLDPRGHDFDDEPDTIPDEQEEIPPMEELFSPEAIAAFRESNK